MTTAIEALRTLINNLGFTEEEKDALRKYFIGNEKRQNDAMTFLPDYTTDEAKIVFLRSLITTPDKNQEDKGSPEDLYVFVDNSNFYIESVKTIRRMEGLGRNFQLFIDYGRLLRVIQKDRKLGRPPTIIGSRPPPLDSLWDRIKQDGYDVHIYDKIIVNVNDGTVKKEKMVDNAIGFHIDEVIFTKTPATIALVSGDCDYYRNLQGALERKWNVELWAWHSGISNYRDLLPDQLFCNKNNLHSQGISSLVKQPSLQTTFIPLDDYYKIFAWCYGTAQTEKMKVLHLADGDDIRNWGNDDVMNCYVALDLFGWWHRHQRGILFLYFRNEEELQKAQQWIREKHPNIWVEKFY